MRDHRELVGEVLPLDGGLDDAVGEPVGANRLENQPPPNEALLIGDFGRSRRTREGGRLPAGRV